jgi:hypothetical protein
MAKTTNKGTLSISEASARRRTNPGISTELRDKIKKCVGVLCFENGGITVKVNRKKDVECAELVNRAILDGKKVTFELTPEDVILVDK